MLEESQLINNLAFRGKELKGTKSKFLSECFCPKRTEKDLNKEETAKEKEAEWRKHTNSFCRVGFLHVKIIH